MHAAERAGRDPATIGLVAVTKGRSLADIQELYQQGCRVFGESRVQEARLKQEQLPKDIDWHLIGTLQGNKVAKAVGHFALIHSVDRPALAQALAAHKGISRCLLQVNTSGETSKRGLSPRAWEPFLEELFQLPGLEIAGLMTMAPLTEEERSIRSAFAGLRECAERWRAQYRVALPTLSMGMSQDFPLAIEEGATLVRIGSALY